MSYPIGKFTRPDVVDRASVKPNIDKLKSFPNRLEKTVAALSPEQLSQKTRPGKWTIAQVVHHIADSHMNMVGRVKLALTEENPTIKPYKENLWAEIVDAKENSVENSLALISALHAKVCTILETLSDEELRRTYYHPDDERNYSLGDVAALYSWHGLHHLAFIEEVLNS